VSLRVGQILRGGSCVRLCNLAPETLQCVSGDGRELLQQRNDMGVAFGNIVGCSYLKGGRRAGLDTPALHTVKTAI